MKDDQGVPASPSGLRPFGAEPAAQSQAEPLVPNATIYLVGVVLRQVSPPIVTTTWTLLSRVGGSRENAIGAAMETAKKQHPAFEISDYSVIVVNRERAKPAGSFWVGLFVGIWLAACVINLAPHVVQLALGIEAPAGVETAQTGSTEGESPAPEGGDAPTPPAKDQANAG